MNTSLHSAPAQMGERIFHWLLDVVPDLVTLRCGDYGKSEVPGLMALNLDVLSNARDMTMMVLNHMYKHPSGNLIQQGHSIKLTREDTPVSTSKGCHCVSGRGYGLS